MKQKLLTFVLCLLVASFLTACGASETNGQPVSALTAAADSGDAPLSAQLLLGSFELEGGDLAITTAQARELLPLWKAVKVLSESDTSSSLELDAVYSQIQSTMTNEQLEAISEISLDGESMTALMEEFGLGIGPGPGMGAGKASGSGNSQMPADMGSIEGMALDGVAGEMQMVVESMTEEERAPAMAERSSTMGEAMVQALVDPMIELLDERTL